MEQLGKYAFIAGVVLAVVAGFVSYGWVWWALAILGLIVGFMNVTAQESKGFLLAAIGLILSASSLVQLPFFGELVSAILGNVVVFIGPALLVVALKSLFETAKD